jgi:hypothetical protein
MLPNVVQAHAPRPASPNAPRSTHPNTPPHTHTQTHTTPSPQVSHELERALPALREAEEALNVLTKKDISELKVGGQ